MINLRGLCALAVFCLVVPVVSAQTETGAVTGTVTSAEGANLPGVTISATGKYLFGERATVTDENGRFRLNSMPVGSYQITFVMPGFRTVVQNEVRVNLGQTRNLNIRLQVSQIQEVLTVTSREPLIDVTDAGQGERFNAESLDDLPTTKDPWSLLEITPGVSISQANVGGNKQGTQARFGANGTSPYQNAYYVDGINLTDTSASGASGQYYDYDTFEAVQVSTAGHDASVGAPGVNITMVTKTGSNDFEARVSYGTSDAAWQSDNAVITEEGSVRSSPQDYNREWNLSFRGPLIKDKLWFFMAYHENDVNLYTPNTNRAPELIDNTVLDQINANLKWAVNQSHTLKLAYNENNKSKSNRLPTYPGNAYYSGLGSAGEGLGWNQSGPSDAWYIQDEWIVTDAFTVNLKYGQQSFPFALAPHGGAPDDILTRFPAHINYESINATSAYVFPEYDRNNDTFTAKGQYFATWGATSHDLSFGYDRLGSENATLNRYPRNAVVEQFDGDLYSGATYGWVWLIRPADITSETLNQALFINDVVTYNRWTFNLGFRYQRQSGSIQAGVVPGTHQEVPADRGVLNGVTFAERFGTVAADALDDVAEWNDFLPRLTVTYDLHGDGRTIFKAGYNQYANVMNTSDFELVSQLAEHEEDYWWEDRDGNGMFLADGDYDEVRFEDGLQYSSEAAVPLADSYEAPLTTELLFNVSHQFHNNLALSASVINRVTDRLTYTFRDGVFGADHWEAGQVTSIDQDVSYDGYRYIGDGEVGRQHGNLDHYETDYTGVEVTATQRGRGWTWNFSFATGSVDLRYDAFELNDPNTAETVGTGRDFTNDYAGEWNARLYGAIELPLQINLSAKLRYESGRYFNAYDRVDSGFQTFNYLVNGRETDAYPSYLLADLGLSRNFSMGNLGNLEVKLDLYNMLNEDTVISNRTNRVTHARFGTSNNINEIIGPRIARLSLSYSY